MEASSSRSNKDVAAGMSASGSTQPRKRSHHKSRQPSDKVATTPSGSEKHRLSSMSVGVSRPCGEHSFLTDVADVRAMERGLLKLLDDFHSGKLRAFGGGASFEKMDQIREQQEHLARLHFELDTQHDLNRPKGDELRTGTNENLTKLVDALHALSASIQTLQTDDSEETPGEK